MSNEAFDHAACLELALNRRGHASSEPLSAGERDCLLEATDLTEGDLTLQTHDSARMQVDGQQVVSGLRTMLPNVPQYMRPLTIQQFMTEKLEEELDGRSPVEWLTASGAVEAVASLVAELEFD